MLTKVKSIHLFILVLICSTLSLVLIQKIVLAQWTPPPSGPSTYTSPDIITSPLSDSLDANGHAFTDIGNINFKDGGAISGGTSSINFSTGIKVPDGEGYNIGDHEILTLDPDSNTLIVPYNINIQYDDYDNPFQFLVNGNPIQSIGEGTGDGLWNSPLPSTEFIQPDDNKAINTESDGGYFQKGDRILKVTSRNIFLGIETGKNTRGVNNVFIGEQAGLDNTSGANNVFIGSQAGLTNTTGSNLLIIHNGGNQDPLLQGNFVNGDLINNGMFQINHRITGSEQNLLYINAEANSTNGNLMKIQNNNYERFRVDLDGNIYVNGGPMFICEGNCPSLSGTEGGSGDTPSG